MYQKKPHIKSRAGCARCKSRKIKCDERKPQCSQCERYSVACDYSSVRHQSSNRGTPSSEGVFSTSVPSELASSQSELDEQSTDLGITDLRLLHDWTLHGYKGFGNLDNEETLWRDEVPQIACTHPFLMHSLLAVSALHLARMSASEREHFLNVAAAHQNKALPAYRLITSDLEGNINAQKGQAMVAFATFTTVYALLYFRPPDFTEIEPSSAIPRLSQALAILRGAGNVVGAYGSSLGGCAITPEDRSKYDDVDFSLNPEDPRLVSLESLLVEKLQSSASAIDAEYQAVFAALYSLRRCFAMLYVPTGPVGIKYAVKYWIQTIPDVFVEALSSFHPGTLIILAHWCILLKGAERYWYFQGSAESFLSLIHEAFDEDWRQYIAWPSQVVFPKA